MILRLLITDLKCINIGCTFASDDSAGAPAPAIVVVVVVVDDDDDDDDVGAKNSAGVRSIMAISSEVAGIFIVIIKSVPTESSLTSSMHTTMSSVSFKLNLATLCLPMTAHRWNLVGICLQISPLTKTA